MFRYEQSCFWQYKNGCCFILPLIHFNQSMLWTFHEDPKESCQLVKNGHLMSPLKTTIFQFWTFIIKSISLTIALLMLVPKHTVCIQTTGLLTLNPVRLMLVNQLRVKIISGASSNGRWRSARSLTTTSSVMWSWRCGRGLQWQPVKLWWTQCPRGLRQCWKIMVATQNINTLGPIWTFSLRGVLNFVASGLDNNGCVLSYFEGTANSHFYTSCTLTNLHCSKVSFLQFCHMKIYIKYLQKCEGCTHFCDILYVWCFLLMFLIFRICRDQWHVVNWNKWALFPV